MIARRLDLVIAVLFLASLALPVIDMATGLVDDPDIDENRSLATFPELGGSRDAWRAFGPAFESWFADHMGLRGSLVATFRFLNQDLLDSADSVLTGRDGWLFLLRDTVDYADRLPLPADLCGRNPFDASELAAWVEALEENRRRVEALGARYVLMIVPNKQSVHGDRMPDRIRCRRGPRRLDQLTDALAARPGFPLLALDQAFSIHAGLGEQLWFRTDTHWDGTGAVLGYRVLIDHVEDRLGRELPDAVDSGAVEIDPMKGSGWGLARMLGRVRESRERATVIDRLDPRAPSIGNELPGHSRGPLRPPERFRHEDESLPTVLALHDSFFGQRFKYLLAESFSQADFVWHRGEPSLGPDLDLVRELKPDIVVHEMVERNLLHPYFDTDRSD